jgi:hypothetical protein
MPAQGTAISVNDFIPEHFHIPVDLLPIHPSLKSVFNKHLSAESHYSFEQISTPTHRFRSASFVSNEPPKALRAIETNWIADCETLRWAMNDAKG